MLYLTYREQNIVNKIAFTKMDQISRFNPELRLQIYSMLKIVDATIMCMLFHEHNR